MSIGPYLYIQLIFLGDSRWCRQKAVKSNKKGQIEKIFNDFLPNRDYFQQNLKRIPNTKT